MESLNETSTKSLSDNVQELIAKYRSHIQNAAEQVAKYNKSGNGERANFWMGMEKAYQNIYLDLTGTNYEPNIET